MVPEACRQASTSTPGVSYTLITPSTTEKVLQSLAEPEPSLTLASTIEACGRVFLGEHAVR